MQIELAEVEFQNLLLMAGFATMAARMQGDSLLVQKFVNVTNAINRKNPNWIRLEVPRAAE